MHRQSNGFLLERYAYRLKASNAAPPFSTSAGTSPGPVRPATTPLLAAKLKERMYRSEQSFTLSTAPAKQSGRQHSKCQVMSLI
jgi:hypothetical protein